MVMQRVSGAFACRACKLSPLIRSASPYLSSSSQPYSIPSVYSPYQARRYASSDYLPMILQPRFWRTLVPKPLRRGEQSEEQVQLPKSKEWNPATFFIFIFLLIGSQAIQLIALQRDYVSFSNQAEAKLSLLREVVKRVQAGEDVDVEAMLGTGDKVKEREWEDGMQVISPQVLNIAYRQRSHARAPGRRRTHSISAAEAIGEEGIKECH